MTYMPHIIMKYIKPIITIVILVLIDQLTKYLIVSNYKVGEGISLISNVFHITYIRNDGAAWGLLSGMQLLFYIITPIVIIIALFLYFKMNIDKRFNVLQILILFVISGAIGNYIDRIHNGYVIDFLYFKLIDFPVFNVADCYLTVSIILLVLCVFFKYTEEDFDVLFKKKDKKTNEQ